MLGVIGNTDNPENSKNLDSHAGKTIRVVDGTIIAGGSADVYRKPILTEMQIGYGAAAASTDNTVDVTKGGGRIIIIRSSLAQMVKLRQVDKMAIFIMLMVLGKAVAQAATLTS